MREGNPATATVAFALIVMAAFIRSGIFPFHSWVVASFESESMLAYAWLLSSRTGALLITKFMVLASPYAARAPMPVVSDLALFSSVLMAIIAMERRFPCRVLGFVVVSQSGFISGGLQTSNVEGITGALVQWIVVSISSAGLRFSSVPWKNVTVSCLPAICWAWSKGSAHRCILPAVRPGTRRISRHIGLSAEDLLFHGALEAHPFLGIALPVATALIAIRLLGLFSSMFLGRLGSSVPAVADAMPRERWVLTAMIALLVIAGLVPQTVIDSLPVPLMRSHRCWELETWRRISRSSNGSAHSTSCRSTAALH